MTRYATEDGADSRVRLSFIVFCLYAFVLVGRPQDFIPALVPFRLALLLSVVTPVVSS